MLRDLFARRESVGEADRRSRVRRTGGRDRGCWLERLERRNVPTTLPGGFSETVVAGGLANPTAMAFAPDGRIFVAEQAGRLRVIKDGALLPTPFLTVDANSAGERGLLGVAFDPDFATNHFVYIYYTVAAAPVHNRVSRFTADGDVAVPGSEVALLDLENLSAATNHNGGAIHFGPDGKLYVGVGENANGSNAQSLNNRLGKILRINADGSIPADNPFFNIATGANRAIWALGLRNPFTFAFQPGTGRMFINDVGETTWEEIDEGVAGANYGWPATEGPTRDPRFRAPLFAYGHGAGDTLGIAITGGAFYDPTNDEFPAGFLNSYFFADLQNRWIRRLDPATGAVTGFATDLPALLVDLKVGADGGLYYLARGSGAATGVVGRIGFTPTSDAIAPTVVEQPMSQTVRPGQQVAFQVAATGMPPLSYQWQFDGADIPGANGPVFILPSASSADDGARFVAVVSNAAGTTVSQVATLSVTAAQPPPVQVQGVRLQLRRGAVLGGVALTFSDVLDGPRPQDPGNYRLTMAGRDRRFGTRDDRTVGFRSAALDAGGRTVLLVPSRRLGLNQRLLLTVEGMSPTGVADRTGQPIDGDANGAAGGDFVTLLRRGMRLATTGATAPRAISARAVDALLGSGWPFIGQHPGSARRQAI